MYLLETFTNESTPLCIIQAMVTAGVGIVNSMDSGKKSLERGKERERLKERVN